MWRVTVSFSDIATLPWMGEPSHDSMDSGRCVDGVRLLEIVQAASHEHKGNSGWHGRSRR